MFLGIVDREIKSAIMRSGLFTAGVLITYFLMIKAIGLNFIVDAHYFNFVIIFFGVLYSIHLQNKKIKEAGYFGGLLTGIATAFLSAIVFNLFLGIYLSVLDPYFMQFLRRAPLGNHMSPWNIAVVLFTEESSAGAVLSLMAMQIYDRNTT
jgi:hypothetical protein